ncbi:DsbC family protein [Candidatus Albibeggiatoa sp. nov. BB20]|uniref:DsbC family protein n=1 Tax=Candidatus Albibeggiatoa sp. nov. BB20 TaxID=3162723 RepID=UPI0033656807
MRFVLFSLLLAFSSTSWAEEVPKVVQDTLRSLVSVPNINIEATKSPITGLYEATIGTEVVYISEDGKYLIVGDIRDTVTRENITDRKRNELRVKSLRDVPDAETVVFAPEGEAKYTVDVFTDVDCPYCARLHREVPELNKNGVKVRYLAFPRAGMQSKTYSTMQSIWCADDRQQAMSDAKENKSIDAKTCKNPISKQYRLGQQVGVSGTPAMVLPNGELLPGYLPASKLVAYLKGELNSFR